MNTHPVELTLERSLTQPPRTFASAKQVRGPCCSVSYPISQKPIITYSYLELLLGDG
ncbi:MAG: hypothetical protein HC816_07960 [Leptolyngbyaceae cyanobacterium RM1_1_2]|nr:hypothetical protein [Leptolyngbyaceae cyanobacterium RM1_1_2]